MKPGQPGPRPHRPGTPRPGAPVPQPNVPGTEPDAPGTRPGVGTASQLTRFEGMRLKLRRAAGGRYALGLDVELALDDAKPGAGDLKPGRPRPKPQADDLEAFAVPEDDDDLEAFAVPDEDDGAALAGGDDTAGDLEGDVDMSADDGAEADAAFAGVDQDETAADFAGNDVGDEGDADASDDDQAADDAAFAGAVDDEGAEGFPESGAGYDEGADDDTGYDDRDSGDAAFAADDSEAADDGGELTPEAQPTTTARWPNRLPVPKGVFAISQAPAIFETQESEDDDRLTAQAAPAPARSTRPVGTVNGMLAAAKRTIGMGEHPPGSNHNKITEWYNSNIARIGNGPWCNMAVTYWAGHSANLAAIFAGRKIGYAYTIAHAQKFRQKGRWHGGVAGIKPGDIVFFAWQGPRTIGNIDHVGVVERVSGKRIVTIEGNTTGDSCRRMVRDPKFIVGYGRPAYGR